MANRESKANTAQCTLDFEYRMGKASLSIGYQLLYRRWAAESKAGSARNDPVACKMA